MRMTRSRAEVWIYHPSKEDNQKGGEFLGWATRPQVYLHYRCGDCFTSKEKHRCVHWSVPYKKEKDLWSKK